MATSKTAYEPLLQGATMHGNECCQHKSECEGQRWKHSVSLYHISVANLALLGLHFILLVGFFAKGMNTHKEEFFQRAYGSNEKYMTLDHSYDFLWADPATQKAGVIAVSRDDQGEVNEIGAISMLVGNLLSPLHFVAKTILHAAHKYVGFTSYIASLLFGRHCRGPMKGRRSHLTSTRISIGLTAYITYAR